MRYGFWYLSQARTPRIAGVCLGDYENCNPQFRQLEKLPPPPPPTCMVISKIVPVHACLPSRRRLRCRVLRYHRFQFTSGRRSRCRFGAYWKQCPRSNRFSSRHPCRFTCVWNCRYTRRFWLLLPIVLLSHYFENAAPSWCRFRFRSSPAVPFRSVFANRWYPNNHTDWFPWKTDHLREKKKFEGLREKQNLLEAGKISRETTDLPV